MTTASVTVEAPATSANLGPGYDTFGLALGLRDVVEATVTFGDGPLRDGNGRTRVSVDMEGHGADTLPTDESHLVARAMRESFAELGRWAVAIDLRCRNVVPHGRGLGSSSAAIVAGVVAARSAAGVPDDPATVLATAARIEGHPDNVAPCVLGGLTVAWTADTVAKAVRLDVHPDVRAVVAIPGTALSTRTARGLLPDRVPHADAAFNAARSALLVEALTRRPELLPEATEDRLHQQYRSPAMPDTARLVGALRAAGLAAVVSGAGPTVLVLATDDVRGKVAAAAPEWDVRTLSVDTTGVADLTGPTTYG